MADSCGEGEAGRGKEDKEGEKRKRPRPPRHHSEYGCYEGSPSVCGIREFHVKRTWKIWSELRRCVRHNALGPCPLPSFASPSPTVPVPASSPTMSIKTSLPSPPLSPSSPALLYPLLLLLLSSSPASCDAPGRRRRLDVAVSCWLVIDISACAVGYGAAGVFAQIFLAQQRRDLQHDKKWVQCAAVHR